MTAPVHDEVEIETAITALGREPGGGSVVMPDTFTGVHRAPIMLAAARNNVPAVYGAIVQYGKVSKMVDSSPVKLTSRRNI